MIKREQLLDKWRHLPNFITGLRMILIIPICYFILQGFFKLSLGLVLLAGLSDGLDGYLARHFAWQTPLGAILDPIADKLLVVCGFAVLIWIKVLPIWLFIIILLKDVVVASGSAILFYLCPHHEFSATLLSKLNTFLQILLLAITLIAMEFSHIPTGLVTYLIYLVALTTIACMSDYIWKGIKKLSCAKHLPHD